MVFIKYNAYFVFDFNFFREIILSENFNISICL